MASDQAFGAKLGLVSWERFHSVAIEKVTRTIPVAGSTPRDSVSTEITWVLL